MFSLGSLNTLSTVPAGIYAVFPSFGLPFVASHRKSSDKKLGRKTGMSLPDRTSRIGNFRMLLPCPTDWLCSVDMSEPPLRHLVKCADLVARLL
jgi:hypothetical protein